MHVTDLQIIIFFIKVWFILPIVSPVLHVYLQFVPTPFKIIFCGFNQNLQQNHDDKSSKENKRKTTILNRTWDQTSMITAYQDQ